MYVKSYWSTDDPDLELDPYDLHKIQGQRSKVTSRSNVKVTSRANVKVTRSLYYSTDILLSKIETGACILDFGS